MSAKYRELGPSYDQQLEDRLLVSIVGGFSSDPGWGLFTSVDGLTSKDVAASAYSLLDAVIEERNHRMGQMSRF